MSCSLTIITAISPTLVGLSFILPLLYGWLNKSCFSALTMGWCLFLLSHLIIPAHERLTQLELINNSSTKILPLPTAPTELNIPLYISIGWILPTMGYFLGKKLRRMRSKQ